MMRIKSLKSCGLDVKMLNVFGEITSQVFFYFHLE